MHWFKYSFNSNFNEILSDRLRALDSSTNPNDFDTKQDWVVFDSVTQRFILEEDKWKKSEESHTGRTSKKRLEWRQAAFSKKYRDLELLPLEIDYLEHEYVQFKVALMNALQLQESSQTEIEWLEKDLLSHKARWLIDVNQKFVEITLRSQLDNTSFRLEDAQRLKKEIEEWRKSSKIVEYLMTWKRYRQDIGYSAFHILSGYEGSLYYSSLTEM